MKSLTLLSAIALIAWNSAFAQKLDPKKSELQWTGEKIGGQHTGTVQLKSGDLDLKKKMGQFEVDMQSIAVGDLEGDLKSRLTNHLRSEDFFNVDKHKTAKLKLTSLESSGKGTYNASGDLTIKGITKPVKFKMMEKGKSYEGEMTFDRTLYDIKYRSGSFIKNLGDKLIKDEVHLKFKLVPQNG
ncbi:MAG: YceI family protein [Bdellovibrionales bacterium]|nr:YceI family protein [Bdellovibrionales bacterium]